MAKQNVSDFNIVFNQVIQERTNDDHKALLLRELTGSSDVTELKHKITSGVVDDLTRETLNRLKQKKVRIYQNLTTSEKDILKKNYPNFQIDFVTSSVEQHPFSHAERIMEYYDCLSAVGYFNFDLKQKKNFYCKDIGGNLQFVVLRGFRNIHCCLPILSSKDAARFSDAYNTFENMKLSTNVMDYQSKLIKNFFSDSHEIYCNNKAQDCAYKSKTGIMIHSVYNVTAREVADMMEIADMNVIVGTFYFSYEMLVRDEGYIPVHNVRWQIRKTRKKEIWFYFDSDFQEPYCHDFDCYISKIKTTHVASTSGKNFYHFKILKFVHNIITFKVVRDITGYSVYEKLYRPIVVPKDTDEKVICYYERAFAGATRFTHLRRKYIVVQKYLLNVIMENMMCLPQNEFTYQKALEFAMSANNRVIVNGVSVGLKQKLDIADLRVVAFASYLHTYEQKYELINTMNIIKEKIDSMRASGIFSAILKGIKGVFDDYIDCLALYFTRLFGDELVTPKFVTQVLDYSPVITEIETIVTNKLYPQSQDVDLIVIDTGIGKKKEVILEPVFATTHYDAICNEELQVADVPGDGNCFFHALVLSGLDTDVQKIKNRLKAFLNDPTTRDDLRQRQLPVTGNPTSVDDWADDETAKILAHIYNVTICIHAAGRVDRHNNKGKIFHMNFVGEPGVPGHYQALLPVQGVKTTNTFISDIIDEASDLDIQNDIIAAYNEADVKFVKHKDYPKFLIKYDVLPERHLVLNSSEAKFRDLLNYFQIKLADCDVWDIGSGPGGFIKVMLEKDVRSVHFTTHKDYPIHSSIEGVLSEVPLGEIPDNDFDLITFDAALPSNTLQNFSNNMNLYFDYFPDALQTLNYRGTLIMKFYLIESIEQAEFLTDIWRHFERVHFFKSSFSSLFNKEFYLVCVNHLEKPKTSFPDLTPLFNLTKVLCTIKNRVMDDTFSFVAREGLILRVVNGDWYYTTLKGGGHLVYYTRDVDNVTPLKKELLTSCKIEELDSLVNNNLVILDDFLSPNTLSLLRLPSFNFNVSLVRSFLSRLLFMSNFSLHHFFNVTKSVFALLSRLNDKLHKVVIKKNRCDCGKVFRSRPNTAYFCCNIVHLPFGDAAIQVSGTVSFVVTVLRDFGYVLRSNDLTVVETCSAVTLLPSAVQTDSQSKITPEVEFETTPEKSLYEVVMEPSEDFKLVETHFDNKLSAAADELFNLWERMTSSHTSSTEIDATFIKTHVHELEIMAYCERRSDPFFIVKSNHGIKKYYPYKPEIMDPMYVYDLDQGKIVPFSDTIENYFVNKDLWTYLDPLFISKFKDRKKEILDFNYSGETNFMSGPPGCGKTTRIVDNYKPGDLVICATKAGVADYLRKFGVDRAENVRTIFSYLLNSEKTYDVVHFDEALMVHPGYLQLVLFLTKCKKIFIFGDYRQIPFIPRVPYRLVYGELAKIISPTEFIPVSYRCPKDVVDWLQQFYAPDVFESKNIRDRTINLAEFVDYDQLNGDTPVIVFLQSEKSKIKLNCNAPVYTIHEFQGKEAEEIKLVRLEYKNYSVYESQPHWIVALSRHTRKFTYYLPPSVSRLDPLYNSLKKHLPLKGGGYCIEYDTLPQYLLSVDTTFTPISSCGGDVFLFKDDFNFKTHGNLLKGRKVFVGSSIVYVKNRVVVLLGAISDITIVLDMFSTKVLHTLDYNYRNDFHKLLTKLTKYRIKTVIHSRKLSVVTSDSVRRVMAKNLEAPVAQWRHKFSKEEIISTSYLPVTLPPSFVNIKSSDVVYFTPVLSKFIGKVILSKSLPISSIRFSSVFTSEKKANKYLLNRRRNDPSPVLVLQNFVNSFLPALDTYNPKFDVYFAQTSEKFYTIENCKFLANMANAPYQIPDNVRPRLVTGVGYDRPYNVNETLLALSKRNMAAPKSDTLYRYHNDAVRSLSVMMRCFTTHPDPFPVLQSSIGAVYDWLSKQPASVQKVLTNKSVYDLPLNDFSVSIKKNPKPLLDFSVYHTYSALQTIVFSSKDVNAFFCPIFRLAMDRLKSVLRDNVIIFSDMSPEEFTMYINDLGMNSDEYIFSHEGDLGKYDKAQHLFHLVLDCVTLSWLGVPDFVVKLWFDMHFYTRGIDRYTKTIFSCNFQRKSGDPSTYNLNTTDNMHNVLDVVLNYYTENLIEYLIHLIVNQDIIFFFSGDDYLILSRIPLQFNYDLTSRKYNFEAKILDYKYSLFCSKFVIRHNGLFFFLPDIFKMVVKLGRRDLKCKEHVEEYRIGFRDNLKGLLVAEPILNQYYFALRERYPGLIISPSLIDTLFFLTSTFDNFMVLFEPNYDFDKFFGKLQDI